MCCGTIYKGPNGEVLIDPRFLKPCKARLAAICKTVPEPTSEEKALNSDSSSSKSDSSSDSSSDSGYDESSNPGAEKESASTSSKYKKEEYLEKCDISISSIAVGN